jgi:ubiquitin carboxyl-terminal hydrolase L5
MSDSWSLTESDPAVFTGLLKGLGVNGLEVEELYGLDGLAELTPLFALVFLFKWVSSKDGTKRDGKPDPDAKFYFAYVSFQIAFLKRLTTLSYRQQVINNACASIAILNATLNIKDEHVQLGDELERLVSFSEGLDSETRGWTISNSEKIREVHNSFAKTDPYSLEEAQSGEGEDAYHFITYLPIQGQLYELDGLTSAPISHGAVPEDWLNSAKE